LLPSLSSFWLGQSFLQMQRPIIAAITVIIAIAKFSSLARRPGLVPGLSFFARKVSPAVERFRGVNADRIY
jgi:hypothetical protein